MVGFSRGAAAARVFASHLYEHGLELCNGSRISKPPIEFLGCFDTVSTQVVQHCSSPFQLLWDKLLKTIPSSKALGEDGKVAPNVKKAVHCVALDDARMWNGFSPTLMGQDERVHEAWFPGIHGDVGGGFLEDALSDAALEYMMGWLSSLGEKSINFIKGTPSEAALVNPKDADGKLDLTTHTLQVDPSPMGHMHTMSNQTSHRPVYAVLDDKPIDGAIVNIHESVYKRVKASNDSASAYHPNPLLKQTSFQVVGPLGKVLEAETEELRKLIQT